MNESPSTVIPQKMSKLQLLQAFFSDRLTTVAVEISVAVEKAFAEYQDEISRSKEENQRLQRLLDSVFNPDVKLHKAGKRSTSLPLAAFGNTGVFTHWF